MTRIAIEYINISVIITIPDLIPKLNSGGGRGEKISAEIKACIGSEKNS